MMRITVISQYSSTNSSINLKASMKNVIKLQEPLYPVIKLSDNVSRDSQI